MAHVGYGFNEHGTKFSKHICDECGEEFTVTGHKDPDDEGWDGCLAEKCASYDPERDVDRMFDEEPWRIKKREESWQ